MLSRFIILIVVVVLGHAAVEIIPTETDIRPAAIRMELPDFVSGVYGEKNEPSAEEKKVLAADTEFEKRVFTMQSFRKEMEPWEAVHATIVMSGNDLNGSIHRPERCLRSQGHSDITVETISIPVGTEGKQLTARQIKSQRPVGVPNGESILVPSIAIYWFVGNQQTTHDHYERTMLDMKGRLFGGFNQRWSYFMVSSSVTGALGVAGGRTEEDTKKLLQGFAKSVFEHSVKTDMLVDF